MKIDWFSFVMGVAWIVVSIIFFVADKDLFITIFMFFAGIINLLKSYYQDRMSLRRLFKKMKFKEILEWILLIAGILFGIGIISLILKTLEIL